MQRLICSLSVLHALTDLVDASRTYGFDTAMVTFDRRATAAMHTDLTHNWGMNLVHSDSELIGLLDRIAARDHAALKLLYELTAPRLYGLALRVVSQREAAEDVLQDAFLTIWRSATDYRATLSPPMAWLGLIVRSRALDCLRRRGANRTNLTQELDEQLSAALEGDQPDPVASAQASQQAAALHRCLSQLDHRHREVISSAYLRDLSHSELAKQLQLPLGTVKTWIRRGLEQLRGCLAHFV